MRVVALGPQTNLHLWSLKFGHMSWRRQMEALLCAFAARDTRYGRAQDLDSGYPQRLGTLQSA